MKQRNAVGLMKRWLIAAALAAGAACLADLHEAVQAAPQHEITLVDQVTGRKKISIAVPEVLVDGSLPDLRPMAEIIRQVVRDDLLYQGLFAPIHEEYYALIPKHDEEHVPYEDWNSIGVEVLVHTRLKESEGKGILEGRLFDTFKDRKMIFGKRYRGDLEVARKLAHSFADDIILQLTGKRGVGLTRLAFISDRTGFKEVFISDYDGYNQNPITANRSINLSPKWSPDALTIAFCSYVFGKPDIFLVSRLGGKLTTLFGRKGLNSTPAWSPDGKRIAFTASFDENVEIYSINADGTGLKRLTSSPAIDTSPCFSPNGQEIVFTSSRGGTPQIYVMDTDGLNIRRMTYEGTFNDLPRWSPDGKFIAYASGDGFIYDIAVLDIKTGITRKLTSGSGRNENPCWSPDGLQIAFSSNRSGKMQICVMNADGSNQREITSGGANTMPDWSSQ
jgi:TolB protein